LRPKLVNFGKGLGTLVGVVGRDSLDRDIQAGIGVTAALRKATALAFLSSFMTRVKAIHEASSIQT
jgi:hypothetical protein